MSASPPKADMHKIASVCPLSGKSGLVHCSKKLQTDILEVAATSPKSPSPERSDDSVAIR
jgi:hypothetical protein